VVAVSEWDTSPLFDSASNFAEELPAEIYVETTDDPQAWILKLPLPDSSASDSDTDSELKVKVDLGKASLFMNFDAEAHVL